MVGHTGAFPLALTGVIAYPRFQTPAESRLAKKHPTHRVDRQALINASAALQTVVSQFQTVEILTVRQYSMALHEIRKLNRQVKQTAERLCQRESPSDPDAASADLVRIFKAAELMSLQFDVIEILANEELARLPLNSVSEIYKLFDKCARIYRTDRRRVVLEAPTGYHPKIEVCDKTFPIIPSVLIENALKYSERESEVRITIRPGNPELVTVLVSNVALLEAPLSDAVFDRGYRGATDREGSGHGLFVAQLVAKQHGSAVRLVTADADRGRTTVTFQVSFSVTTGR